MSLYERLGQDQGIRTAVDEFYQRVLADPELTPYFDGVDMGRLRGHQAKLLVQVTGGPVDVLTGDYLAELTTSTAWSDIWPTPSATSASRGTTSGRSGRR